MLKRLSVLLVEDNDDARRQFAQLLGLWLGPVYVAANGREGLEQYRAHRPDLVISDILMPEMDGLTMVEHIKDENPDAVIIVTTALGEQEHLLRAIDLGVDRYITKPIVSQLLLDAIYKAARVVVHQREMGGLVRLLREVLDQCDDMVLVYRTNRLVHVSRGLREQLGIHHDQAGDEPELRLRLDGLAADDWLRHALLHPQGPPDNIGISVPGHAEARQLNARLTEEQDADCVLVRLSAC